MIDKHASIWNARVTTAVLGQPPSFHLRIDSVYRKHPWRWIMRVAAALVLLRGAAAEPLVVLPDYRLTANELAVVVNQQDPLSERIAAYYMERRKVPVKNLIRISTQPQAPVLSVAEFTGIFEQVRAQTAPHIKAYALTWTRPYRVDCMSIGTAFAAGFDRAWCSEHLCAPTRFSPYAAPGGRAVMAAPNFRPTMVIAATDFSAAQALIERGIAADDSHPAGTAYLLNTSDANRTVRAVLYPEIVRKLAASIAIETLDADFIRDREDVMFYFTGLTRVEHLDTLRFLPGAVADHLTSAGGMLPPSRLPDGNTPVQEAPTQMSSIEWLRAGATGSYGAVVEPCNFKAKFPHPGILMELYLKGKTLLEAYWRSVGMPGEGIFVGEPLASPFGGYRIESRDGGYLLHTNVLDPNRYRIDQAASPVGPYTATRYGLDVKPGERSFSLPDLGANVLKLTPLTP